MSGSEGGCLRADRIYRPSGSIGLIPKRSLSPFEPVEPGGRFFFTWGAPQSRSSIGETGLPIICDDDGGSGLFDGLAELSRFLFSGGRPTFPAEACGGVGGALLRLRLPAVRQDTEGTR